MPHAALYDIDEMTPNGAAFSADNEPIPLMQANPAADFYMDTYNLSPTPILPSSEPRSERHVADPLPTTRGRKPSIAAWSCCGVTPPNLALRALSLLVAAPTIVCLLIYYPVEATAYIAMALMCLMALESSWIAYRIHFQVVTTFYWYENSSKSAAAVEDEADELHQHPFRSIVSGFTQSMSYDFTCMNYERDSSVDESYENAQEPTIRRSAVPFAPSPLDSHEFDPTRCVVSTFAASWCQGRVWLAKLLVAAPLTALWMAGSYLAFRSPARSWMAAIPAELADDAIFFWSTNFLAMFCACSTPTWRDGLCLLLSKWVFASLLTRVLSCPVQLMSTPRDLRLCAGAVVYPTHLFMLGMMVLLLVRVLSSAGPMELIVSAMLQLVSYLYVVGMPLLLAAQLDSQHALPSRMLLLLLAVVWSSEAAGVACEAVMRHFQIAHRRLFPRRLSVQLDVEATVAALITGTGSMLALGAALEIPGSAISHVGYVFWAIICGRFGKLYVKILKRAAGMRYTSRLIPGVGGVLDACGALPFTALLFAQFFAHVVLS